MTIVEIESRIQEIEQDIKRAEASLLRMQGAVIALRDIRDEMIRQGQKSGEGKSLPAESQK